MELYKYPLYWVIEYPIWVAAYFLAAGISSFAISDTKPAILKFVGQLLYTPLYFIAGLFSKIAALLPVVILLSFGLSKGSYIGVAFYVTLIIFILLFVHTLEKIRHAS